MMTICRRRPNDPWVPSKSPVRVRPRLSEKPGVPFLYSAAKRFFPIAVRDLSGAIFTRSIHDLTAAAWFGGSLMGAIGLNGAAAEAKDPAERTRLSSAGWMKWAPFQTAAFASHLVADLAIAWENKGRIAKQEGVARYTVIKTAVTVVGAAVTLYSGILGKKVEKLSGEGAEGATEPHGAASDELKAAQQQLKLLQWAIPGFAALVIILGAKHGELQRPENVAKGLARSTARAKRAQSPK